jgi:hypothetical protein
MGSPPSRKLATAASLPAFASRRTQRAVRTLLVGFVAAGIYLLLSNGLDFGRAGHSTKESWQRI